MKRIYQTRFGGSDAPQAEQGNCFQACVASILEIPLEEAFDMMAHEEGHWFDKFQEWLRPRGLGCFYVGADRNGGPTWPIPGYHIIDLESTTLAVKSDGHVAVMLDGEVVHDPNPRATHQGKVMGYFVFVALDPARR